MPTREEAAQRTPGITLPQDDLPLSIPPPLGPVSREQYIGTYVIARSLLYCPSLLGNPPESLSPEDAVRVANRVYATAASQDQRRALVGHALMAMTMEIYARGQQGW